MGFRQRFAPNTGSVCKSWEPDFEASMIRLRCWRILLTGVAPSRVVQHEGLALIRHVVNENFTLVTCNSVDFRGGMKLAHRGD
jgi:hypothetical protein